MEGSESICGCIMHSSCEFWELGMHVRCKGTCKMHRNDSYFPYVIFGVRATKSFKPGTGLNLEILHGTVTSSDELLRNVPR